MRRSNILAKSISSEIPESLALSLDKLAKSTGRKKNLLLAASSKAFLETNGEE